MKLTKIIATIGPNSHDEKTISGMVLAGMNMVRMNFSHGTSDFHEESFRLIRKVSQNLNRNIGIIIDLQGPKIRIGSLKKDEIMLNKDDTIELTTDDVDGDWNILSVDYKKLPEEAKIGDRILLDDGNIELRVIEVTKTGVVCKIMNSGTIRSHRGLNFPESKISVSSVTEKDQKDLAFAIENGADFIALSFVRESKDIEQLRTIMNGMGADLPVIAKIEKQEAVQNIDDIIKAANGIMVARGDLGAETSSPEVPILQKMIIKKCNLAGKPVITATQMFESMIKNPHPTRAEAADVANAIFDGTDAVMLSGETAIGDYPIEAVRIMANVAIRTEREIFREKTLIGGSVLDRLPEKRDIADTLSYAATYIADLMDFKFIVSFTLSGKTATLVSKYRPSVPIIAMSPSAKVLRKLTLFWGVHGMHLEQVSSTEELISQAETTLIQNKVCEEGDTVLIIGGVPVLAGSPTNVIKVHTLKLENRNF
jgi:pyruvate kinase